MLSYIIMLYYAMECVFDELCRVRVKLINVKIEELSLWNCKSCRGFKAKNRWDVNKCEA